MRRLALLLLILLALAACGGGGDATNADKSCIACPRWKAAGSV